MIQLNNERIWDRKVDNGFPEAKELKQRVRDKIAPTKSLGHSDVKEAQSTATLKDNKEGECLECKENANDRNSVESKIEESDIMSSHVFDRTNKGSPNVVINYCTGCRWMLRSAWMCQELLSTFEQELHSVTLVPNHLSPGTFVSLHLGACLYCF